MKIFLIVSSVIVMFILSLTLWISPNIIVFIIARGSDVSQETALCNPCIVFMLFALFLVGIVINLKLKKVKYGNIILSILFITWLLSTRIIAYDPSASSEESKVLSGWLFFRTHTILTCIDTENCDCEKVNYYGTYIEKLPLWRIRIKNKELDTVIFVGPFIWKKTLKILEKHFPYDSPRDWNINLRKE